MNVPRKRDLLVASLLVAATSSVALASTAQDSFRARFGNRVVLRISTTTGYVQDVFGRALDIGARPQTDEDYATAARAFVDEYAGLFGVTGMELTGDDVHHHDLASIDSTSKTSVEFAQTAGTMRVEGASLCVLFDADGRVLSLQNFTVPGALGVDQRASVSRSSAVAIASRELGHPVAAIVSFDTAVVAGLDGKAILGHLVELRSSDYADGIPIQERLTIDAHTGDLVRRENRAFSFTDITGNVNGWASPGILPDESSNPETLQSLYWAHVSSAVGSADTDVNGNFTISYGGSTPQSVTCKFDTNDKRANVINDAGSELSTSVTITPGVPGQITMNPVKDEGGTAQVNAHVSVVRAWQFVKAIDSSDTHVDFKAIAHVLVAGSCNAYYDGASINFYAKGGGCQDMAYSTVVGHELGHWYNDKYGSGNGGDGFGEGNADVFAMYEWDDRYVAKDWAGSGTFIRDGENKRKYCGHCGAGCYGEVHTDGEVLMGALWKVRRNLNNSFGDTQGDLIADTLMVKWMQAYNDKTICDTIENHWLVLDDTDGNIFNGTPHFSQIDSAFREQGFPGITLQNDCTTPVNYGTGTAGSFGLVPHITSSNDPQIGTSNFTIHGENTEFGLSGFLAVGFAKATIFYGSTVILVDVVGPHFLVHITTGGSALPGGGTIDVPAAIPNDPSLDGIEFYSQYLFLDGGAQSGLAATEGLDTIICCGC